MRLLRLLASMAMTGSLLATPVLSNAQSELAGNEPATPLARQPEGRLPLEGTPWRLEGYHFRDRVAAPGPEVAAFMRLGPSGLEASGGCTRLKGRYGVVGPAISFELRGSKEPDCAEQTTIVQLAMVSGLKKAASYEIVAGEEPAEDKLLLRGAGGQEVLRFGLDDISSLDDADWLLASYSRDGLEVAASSEQPALLSFRPDRDSFYKRRSSGPLSGSTGCNGIVAEFYRYADVLSFSELQRTDAPCTPELAAQEGAMTAVLDATALTLDLAYDRLTLTSSDSGERLEFASRRPTEGSTWLLSGGPWMARPDGRVTMRLVDGVASGEGPCGPWSAAYATDGVFATFRFLQGAGDEECADLKAEQAMLAGLRVTVTLERRPERLRMRDAFGVTTIAFELPAAP